MSSRLAAAAAIRRASAAARRRLEDDRKARQSWLERQIQQAATAIRGLLARLAGSTSPVPLAVLGPIRREAEVQSAGLARRLLIMIDEAIASAVNTGASAVGAAIADDARAIAANRTMGILRSFIAADGLQLSDRVWRVRDGTRAVIVRTLEQALTEGWSGIEAAQRMIGQGLAVTPEIKRAIDNAGLGPLQARISDALMTGTGNPLANANRLLSTEINRAYTEAFVESLRGVDGVAGVRFLLSPRHPKVDQCDMHAGVNLHAMGAGVYPLGSHPYPAHPQTLSFLEAVFDDEITDADRAGKQTRSEWLASKPAALQNQILGQAKGRAFRAGHVPEFGLRTPWRVLRERLARRGVDVDAIERGDP